MKRSILFLLVQVGLLASVNAQPFSDLPIGSSTPELANTQLALNSENKIPIYAHCSLGLWKHFLLRISI